MSGAPPIFISYASPDRQRAAALHARLQTEGLDAWFDRDRLESGHKWHDEIAKACDAAQLVLPILTPNWGKSEWTKFETYAIPSAIPLIPEGEATALLPPPLRGSQAHALDPALETGAGWPKLLAAIRRERANPPAARAKRLHNVPYSANRHFTGRETEMNRLLEALHPGPAAYPTDTGAMAIVGLGGVGKTTLAAQYALRFHRLYPQRFWVDARLGYESQFAAIYDMLPRDYREPGLKDPDKAIRALNALRDETPRLLVIDNVDDAHDVEAWIPHHGGCRTLLTSRPRHYTPSVGTIDLGSLSKPVASAFLRDRAGNPGGDADQPARETLAERLGGLPLALEQAGAYMHQQRMPAREYLRHLAEATKQLLSEKAPGSTRHDDPVAATWQVTMRDRSPEARAILHLTAALGLAPVALEMLVKAAPEIALRAAALRDASPARKSWLPWRSQPPPPVPMLPDRGTAERMVRDAVVKELHGFSMVQDWDGESFRVHTLVREIEWLDMDKPARTQFALLAVRSLEAHAPADPSAPAAREATETLLVHGAALRDRLGGDEARWPDHMLPGILYECASARGAVVAAETYAYEHYEQAKRHLGPTHATTRRAASRVARSLHAKGRYREARPIFEVVLRADEAEHGPEHPDTLGSRNNLAGCLHAMGDLAAAEPLYRRTLEASERVLGPEHPDTLTSRNNLASCLLAMGDLAAAEPLYRRTLEARERVLGPEHPDTLSSRNNLAACLKAMGDLAAAEPLYRHTLEARERVLGPEHPDTLSGRNNFAACLDAMGDLAAAEPLYRRTLEARERVLGPEHPDTLTSRNNLAACLLAMGDLAAAEPLYRRTLAARERVLGPEHPDTLTSRNNLAHCLDAMGDLAAAEPLFRAALAGAERVLGANHPYTIGFRNNLAKLLVDMARVGRPALPAAPPPGPAQWSLTGIQPATAYTLGGTSFTLDLGKRD